MGGGGAQEGGLDVEIGDGFERGRGPLVVREGSADTLYSNGDYKGAGRGMDGG